MTTFLLLRMLQIDSTFEDLISLLSLHFTTVGAIFSINSQLSCVVFVVTMPIVFRNILYNCLDLFEIITPVII